MGLKEVTDTESQVIDLLRRQKWSRVTFRFHNGEMGPIEVSETVQFALPAKALDGRVTMEASRNT